MPNAGFNSLKFNRSPFNTKYILTILFNFDVEGVSEAQCRLNVIFSIKSDVESTSETSVRLTKERNIQFIADALSEADVKIISMINAAFDVESVSEAAVDIAEFIAMRYEGTLAPGDELIIDTCEFTVMKNGVNDLDNFSGSFLQILPGETRLIYEDSEVSRNANITILFTEKFL